MAAKRERDGEQDQEPATEVPAGIISAGEALDLARPKEPQTPADKEATLAELRALRVISYDLLEEYTIPSSKETIKTLKLKRWSFGLSQELLPSALEIAGFGLSLATGGPKGDMFAFLSEENTAKLLTKHAKALGMLIGVTLIHAENKNGFKDPQDAIAFVLRLDNYDIMQIVKILYKQNLESLLKNVAGELPMKGVAEAPKAE